MSRISTLTQATKKYTVSTVTVTSEDESKEKTYKIVFVTNIAINCTAWAPTGYSGMGPSYGVDGSLNTMYFSSVAVERNGYFNIGLESISDVYGVKIYTTQTSTTSSFAKFSVSEDGVEWTPVEGVNLKHISTDGSMYELEFVFEDLPITTKYIQVSGTTNASDKMRISELEVYGVRPPAVSSNSLIKTIELSSGSIPGFSKYINSYTLKLESTEQIPTIVSAEAEDEYATVEIVQATESDPVAKVTVLAENKASKTTYTISFEKQLAPEKNTYLSSLNFNSGTLLPKFSPANTSYTLYLPSGQSIEKEGKFLVCRRGPGGNCPFLWEFPGGKIEPGETPFEAIIREIKEELSADIEPSEIFCEYPFSYPEKDIYFYNINFKCLFIICKTKNFM